MPWFRIGRPPFPGSGASYYYASVLRIFLYSRIMQHRTFMRAYSVHYIITVLFSQVATTPWKAQDHAHAFTLKTLFHEFWIMNMNPPSQNFLLLQFLWLRTSTSHITISITRAHDLITVARGRCATGTHTTCVPLVFETHRLWARRPGLMSNWLANSHTDCATKRIARITDYYRLEDKSDLLTSTLSTQDDLLGDYDSDDDPDNGLEDQDDDSLSLTVPPNPVPATNSVSVSVNSSPVVRLDASELVKMAASTTQLESAIYSLTNSEILSILNPLKSISSQANTWISATGHFITNGSPNTPVWFTVQC